MPVNVDVSLSRDLVAAVDELETEVVEQVVAQSGDLVERDLRSSSIVPVRTGRLRRGYRTQVRGDVVEVVNPVPYSEHHAEAAVDQVEATAVTFNQRIRVDE